MIEYEVKRLNKNAYSVVFKPESFTRRGAGFLWYSKTHDLSLWSQSMPQDDFVNNRMYLPGDNEDQDGETLVLNGHELNRLEGTVAEYNDIYDVEYCSIIGPLNVDKNYYYYIIQLSTNREKEIKLSDGTIVEIGSDNISQLKGSKLYLGRFSTMLIIPKNVKDQSPDHKRLPSVLEALKQYFGYCYQDGDIAIITDENHRVVAFDTTSLGNQEVGTLFNSSSGHIEIIEHKQVVYDNHKDIWYLPHKGGVYEISSPHIYASILQIIVWANYVLALQNTVPDYNGEKWENPLQNIQTWKYGYFGLYDNELLKKWTKIPTGHYALSHGTQTYCPISLLEKDGRIFVAGMPLCSVPIGKYTIKRRTRSFIKDRNLMLSPEYLDITDYPELVAEIRYFIEGTRLVYHKSDRIFEYRGQKTDDIITILDSLKFEGLLLEVK